MVEAQAAARVDRLDQDKPVTILRYIVKDSIEEVFILSAQLPYLSTLQLTFHPVDQGPARTQTLACEAFYALYNDRHLC